MRDGGYPAGAKFDKNAPYNQPTIRPEEVEVDIIVTMSLRTTINVDDYETEEDIDYDTGKKVLVNYYDNCDLMKHVKDQVKLPQDMETFKNWELDDFQVFLT